MNQTNNISGKELVSLANLTSIILSENFTENELITLSSFFTILGDSLAAIASLPIDNCTKKDIE